MSVRRNRGPCARESDRDRRCSDRIRSHPHNELSPATRLCAHGGCMPSIWRWGRAERPRSDIPQERPSEGHQKQRRCKTVQPKSVRKGMSDVCKENAQGGVGRACDEADRPGSARGRDVHGTRVRAGRLGAVAGSTTAGRARIIESGRSRRDVARDSRRGHRSDRIRAAR